MTESRKKKLSIATIAITAGATSASAGTPIQEGLPNVDAPIVDDQLADDDVPFILVNGVHVTTRRELEEALGRSEQRRSLRLQQQIQSDPLLEDTPMLPEMSDPHKQQEEQPSTAADAIASLKAVEDELKFQADLKKLQLWDSSDLDTPVAHPASTEDLNEEQQSQALLHATTNLEEIRVSLQKLRQMQQMALQVAATAGTQTADAGTHVKRERTFNVPQDDYYTRVLRELIPNSKLQQLQLEASSSTTSLQQRNVQLLRNQSSSNLLQPAAGSSPNRLRPACARNLANRLQQAGKSTTQLETGMLRRSTTQLQLPVASKSTSHLQLPTTGRATTSQLRLPPTAKSAHNLQPSVQKSTAHLQLPASSKSTTQLQPPLVNKSRSQLQLPLMSKSTTQLNRSCSRKTPMDYNKLQVPTGLEMGGAPPTELPTDVRKLTRSSSTQSTLYLSPLATPPDSGAAQAQEEQLEIPLLINQIGALFSRLQHKQEEQRRNSNSFSYLVTIAPDGETPNCAVQPVTPIKLVTSPPPLKATIPPPMPISAADSSDSLRRSPGINILTPAGEQAAMRDAYAAASFDSLSLSEEGQRQEQETQTDAPPKRQKRQSEAAGVRNGPTDDQPSNGGNLQRKSRTFLKSGGLFRSSKK